MAKATIDTNKPYVNAAKFSIANSELVLDKKASTVILSGVLDATYSGTNITINTQHFGTGTARYGKEWIGVLLPAAGYKLPDDVNITIGGAPAAKGSDYSYNSITGEIKIEVVKGNIAVTADGAPITYTINYNANGGLVNGKDSEILTVNFGNTITFPTATRKAGSQWLFLGWAYKPDAVKADFAGGATTNKPLSNIDTAQITLYAVWKSSDSSLPTSLQNGSFEVPVNSIFSNMYDYTKPNNIKWLTTASDRKIELGNPSKGLNAAYDAYGTRNASEGLQFAELNATRVAALYQMVATEPGSTLYWGLDHRARSKTEKETMEVWIGSSTEVNEAINAYKADGNQVSIKTQAVFAKCPTLQRTANITHDWSAWHPVDGTYNVPTGQTETMFAFVSIAKPASNSCGNLLDNVFFSTVKPLARREITIRAGMGGTVRVSDASGFTTVNSSTSYNKSLELGDMLQATVMANSGYSFNGGYVDGKYYTKEALLTDFSNLRLTMGDTAPNITPKEITILFAKDSIISLIPNG
ncbi:MAG: InlB B-repeat-containing protein, partial [Oscillospiraceae bacterium]